MAAKPTQAPDAQFDAAAQRATYGAYVLHKFRALSCTEK
jgi:hypothetical protein